MPKLSSYTTVTSLSTTDNIPAFVTGVSNKKITALNLAGLNGIVGAKMFGCVGDGVTDDTTNLQTAITTCAANGYILYLNAGVYLVSSTLNITGPCTILGAGKFRSVVKASSTTLTVFTIATTSAITFEGFEIQGSATASNGSLVSLDSGSGVAINQFSVFRDVVFQSGFVQFNTISASNWMLDNCLFFSPTAICVNIQDVAHTDAGDQTIQGCIFSGTAGVGTAVSQSSAGGLKMYGCKVIQFANGYSLSLAAGVATSDLFISGNSFEAFTGSIISLTKGTGTVFGAIQITGNELSGAAVGINMSPDSGPWNSHIEVVGNNIGVNAGGTGVVMVGANDFIVTGNTIVQAAPTSGTGVSIGVNTSNGVVRGNTIIGFTLPVNNAHVGTTVVVENNFGYNPVGGAAVTPGASPWTLTNGATTAMYYLSAATSITALTIGGVSVLPAATAANVTFPLLLGPNQAAVITFTGAMTAKKNTM